MILNLGGEGRAGVIISISPEEEGEARGWSICPKLYNQQLPKLDPNPSLFIVMLGMECKALNIIWACAIPLSYVFNLKSFNVIDLEFMTPEEFPDAYQKESLDLCVLSSGGWVE